MNASAIRRSSLAKLEEKFLPQMDTDGPEVRPGITNVAPQA
jgi:hypothetical protein